MFRNITSETAKLLQFLSTLVCSCSLMFGLVHSCSFLFILVHTCSFFFILLIFIIDHFVNFCPILSIFVHFCPFLSIPVYFCPFMIILFAEHHEQIGVACSMDRNRTTASARSILMPGEISSQRRTAVILQFLFIPYFQVCSCIFWLNLVNSCLVLLNLVESC